MNHPADTDAKRDRRLGRSGAALWAYVTAVLDIHEVRRFKAELHAPMMGWSRKHVGIQLDRLVALGYLIEHPRDEKNVRRLTLAYSLNDEKRQSA